ncbi:MAG TPA: hypothetical protein VGE13_02230 [Candidatus Saccharimonadales bacterium]
MEKVTMKPSWHRWFRRTNVHIAEYILMLLMMGSFLGILVSLWFSFFGLVYEDGFGARMLTVATAAQLASLVVVAPIAFWLYARTSGQEMVQQELTDRKSHTVFLTIWMVVVVSVLVGMLIAAVTSLMQAMFGVGDDDFGKALVTKVLPSLFGVATIVFGLMAVVKHPARKLSMLAGIVLAVLSLVLLVANVVMVIVRKDVTQPVEQQCTYTRYYLEKECSYSDYLRDRSSNFDRVEGPSNSSRLDSLFTPRS